VGIRDSVVRMVRSTGWMARNRDSVPNRIRDFLLPLIATPGLEHTYPPIRQVPAALYLGARCPGREMSPYSAKANKNWNPTSTPPYAIITCTRRTLPFTLYTFSV
jgi:hypothetical protein